MSTKALKKQLMAAIAMVLVAAVALGSSTYAWFAANKIVMEKLAKAQAELLELAIADWRKEEMEKVKQNPSAYVKSSNSNSNA